MVSIEEALELIHSQSVKKTSAEMSLESALGYYLAAEITAPFDLPDFDNSAMDGYALCGLFDEYQIVGEVAAGDTGHYELTSGQAMRIFTGGKVPDHTTAVVMQEKTSANNAILKIEGDIKAGQNIRKKGGELSKGQEVFKSGHKISPATIGLIGSLGFDQVSVYKKPSVSLITTGNELITPGQKRKEGQIYESNSVSIATALNQFGFKLQEKQQVQDDYKMTVDAIGEYLEKSDVLLLSGGISVGDYDYVYKALEENGVQEVFYKIFQKPGKPLFFGKKDHKFVFALPGNPASSLTCFYVYVLPLLQKMSGASKTGLTRIHYPLGHAYDLKGDRPSFLKAHLDNEHVSILDHQSSSMIYSMSIANALAFLKPGQYKKQDLVECLLID